PGMTPEGGGGRRGLAEAEPAVQGRGQRIAGRAQSEDHAATEGHGRPQDVQPDQAPEAAEPAVDGGELFEGEEHDDLLPAAPVSTRLPRRAAWPGCSRPSPG